MSTPVNVSTRDFYKTLARFGAVCLIMGGGLVSLKALSSALNWKIEKPPVPLRKELSKIPPTLGTPWKYEAFGSDLFMTDEELQALGTDQYLLRDYKDIAKRDHPVASGAPDVGTILRLNLNYYPAGTGTVHVPDICWTASGLIRNTSFGDLAFVVKDVKLADGSTVDLPVRMLAFEPTPADIRFHPTWASEEGKHLLCVAYTFNVNGEYVSNRFEVMQKFWKTNLPFAYHAKIEVKVNERCSPEEAQPVVAEFFREVLPKVSECLPDVNELKAKAAATRAASMPASDPKTTHSDALENPLKDSASKP